MADVAMGNLRFDLTADNSQFMAAVKQAKEAQTQAAAEMGSKFAEASTKAEAAWASMATKAIQSMGSIIAKMRELDKSFSEAAAEGAEGFEKVFTKGVDKTFGLVGQSYDKFNAWIAKKGPLGQTASAVLDVIDFLGGKRALEDGAKKASAIALSAFSENFDFSKYTSKIRDGLVANNQALADSLKGSFDDQTLSSIQEKVKTWADRIKKTLDDAVEGWRIMLRKMAGTWDGVHDDVKAAIDALKGRTAAEQFQTTLLGKDRGDRTEAQERQRVLQDIGKEYDELNEKEKKLVETELQRRVDVANDFEARQKELEQTRQREQAVTSLTAALKRQADMALANAGRSNGGKSAFERAMEQSSAMSEGYGRGRNAGLLDDPRVAAAREDAARKAQEAANSTYRSDQSRMLREANDKGYLDQSSLGARPGETEKLRVEMELMNKARREGATLDAGQIALNASIAESMGKIAQATAEARERYEALREVGRTVASSLEGAFSSMIQGTGFQWKQFISGLQADLAKLAFRRGIESLLTGGASSGGGLFGALAGIISGARADGGPVGSGNAYIVGERGPEMFVPQSAGSIVPNHAMGGGGNASVINMRIDLKGANGDETIARISAQAARQAAMAAVRQSNEAFPERQRTLSLLGS